MSNINLKFDNIKQEITKPQPSSSRIFTHLREVKSNDEFKTLTDSDYYDIVGETFKLNPEFFMASIYPQMRDLEMAKYIVEKYCLYDNEQIIYEFRGGVTQLSNPTTGNTLVKVSVTGGTVFVTNLRIIAQGTLSVKGGRFFSGGLIDLVITPMTGVSARKKSKKSVIDDSLFQEIPCYGYQFKSRAHVKLKKKSNAIKYVVIGDVRNLKGASAMTIVKAVRTITITLPSAHVNELFDILSKDVEQVIDMFQELQDMGMKRRMKRNEFLYRLRKLWETEEYRNFTDSDYLDVVAKVYELDPELFMTSIYPKMRSWTYPSFLRVKEKIMNAFEE